MYDLPLARRTSEVRGENARRSGQTELKSIGLDISGGSGDGVLSYQGKDYPLAISGINIADVGVSQFQGAGKVYDLKNGADFSVAMPPRRLRWFAVQREFFIRAQ